MLIIATYARERVKNRGRKRRASVSVIEGAFPIRFPARANKQTNERRVVVEEEFRRKEEDKAVFSIAPFYSGWRAWPCRRRAYQSSSFGRILFSQSVMCLLPPGERKKCEVWCTCFITKTEVFFFLICALKIVIFGREFSLSTLTFHFFIYSFIYFFINTLLLLLSTNKVNNRCSSRIYTLL